MRWLVGTILVFWTASAWADRLVVPPVVCLPAASDRIALEHLAQADGTEAAAFLERWGNRSVLDAPPVVGARRTLERDAVRQAILRAVGPSVPEVDIPAQVVIQRGGQVFSMEALRGALERALLEQLRPLGDEVALRDWRLPAWFFVPTEETVRIRLAPLQPRPGVVALRLEAVDGAGQVAASVTGEVTADVWQEVPCALRSLARGEVLDAAVVRSVRVNMAELPRPVWDGASLGAVRARGNIPAGRVILAEMVEPVPVVERGRTVTLVYEGPALRLAVPAQILEDGGVGSRVRVRNLQSQRVVVARVVDSTTVRVEGL
jgi:flagella basal body P-ring formation protein FlgA